VNDKKADAAVKLAKEFIADVAAWKKSEQSYENYGHTFTHRSAAMSGAVKRRSMDLTRALADLRRPG
jgi:hypothetical protein